MFLLSTFQWGGGGGGGGGGLAFVAQGCNGFLIHNQRGEVCGTVLSLVSFQENRLQQV